MLPRVPLPFKLLFSYLCIVIIGAGPTFVYVRAKLEADLMADSASSLVLRGKRVARVLSHADAPQRLVDLRLLGEASVDRITYLSPRGEVLFDNEAPDTVKLENHLGRPEVRYAMGDTNAPQANFAKQVRNAEGVGIARRISDTTRIDTLYVALRITSAQDETVGVLRIATSVDRIQTMTTGTVHFARNAQAVAMSLAIGFSLLAALLFVRPLQRVSKMVHALAAGDIGAQVGQLGNDEVGDVGRALESMAMALRRRLLAAGLGEALLSQLVEALSTPCLVFEEGGEMVAMNGAARRSLGIEGQYAGRRMKEFAEHPEVVAALSTAEYEGEPEPISISLSWQVEASGSMHVLKRPGMAPLRVFIGYAQPESSSLQLPNPEQIHPQSLKMLIEEAMQRVGEALALASVKLEIVTPPSDVMIVDANGQVMIALSESLMGCAKSMGGRKEALRLNSFLEPLALRIELSAAMPASTAEHVRKLLEPLGGLVKILSTESHLWLPRA